MGMSAQPEMPVPSARGAALAPGGTVHPLRGISFGDPAVTVERRDDGTIYLSAENPTRRYSGPAYRPSAPVGERRARPHLHG